MNICTVVCSYPRTLEGSGNELIKKFSRAGLDNFHVLFDNQGKLSEKEVAEKYESSVCLYDDEDFKNYEFNKPINTRHRWGSHQNPKYFYAHFRMLVFYLKNPNFDHYWFFDDDVDFDGNLSEFLSAYKTEEEDFIAIQAFKKEKYEEELPKISIINNRMAGSHGNWLGLCPGAGDNFKSQTRHLGSFFPIVRFTKKAMNHLLDLHHQGFYGYSEGFVPTSLSSDGLKVASMMDEFNNFFLKNKSDCTLYHKGSKFTWEWL
jgi:hypothetical protein